MRILLLSTLMLLLTAWPAVALLNDRPRFMRVEVLVDRTFAPVRVFLRRDVTALGFPFPGERGEALP